MTGEDRGDLCLSGPLKSGIKNTTSDFLIDGVMAVGVVFNEPHLAGIPLVHLSGQGRVTLSASHVGRSFPNLL